MLEIGLFVLVTLIYFVGRYFITNPGYLRIMMFAYVLFIGVSQLIVNINLLSSLCTGASNFWTALGSTIVPWILIFGTVYGALAVFPGWKQPFSNTFGYGIAKLMGVNKILNTILKPRTPIETPTQKTLDNIYGNPALFINQITPQNFDEFVKKSKFLFVSGVTEESMNQFRNIIRAKELVGECLWYLLSGILAITVSYNTIINTECSNSVDEMKKRHDEYEANVQQQEEEAKNAPPPRIYYTRD
jgi:hypothetical protein